MGIFICGEYQKLFNKLIKSSLFKLMKGNLNGYYKRFVIHLSCYIVTDRSPRGGLALIYK